MKGSPGPSLLSRDGAELQEVRGSPGRPHEREMVRQDRPGRRVMWVLFLGDVVGSPGRRAVREFLRGISARRDLDLVVANCENAAGGTGITDSSVRELYGCGVDVLTGGNHIW